MGTLARVGQNECACAHAARFCDPDITEEYIAIWAYESLLAICATNRLDKMVNAKVRLCLPPEEFQVVKPLNVEDECQTFFILTNMEN